MIRHDRELLAHLSAVNTRLGEAVVELFAHQDGGELPADGLRVLGDHLQSLATRLLDRAAELQAAELPRAEPHAGGGQAAADHES